MAKKNALISYNQQKDKQKVWLYTFFVSKKTLIVQLHNFFLLVVIIFLSSGSSAHDVNRENTYHNLNLPNQTTIYPKNAVRKNSINTINENEKIYEITSSSNFSDFYRMLCEGNTFANYTVILTKDITFKTDGKTGQRIFEGRFEGQGHKISDITTSLFTINQGEIRNLHIASGTLNSSGVFCTKNYGNIIGCKNSANINISSSSTEGVHGAAFCSSNYGNIMNCVNEGNITLELIAISGNWSKAVTSCGGICAYSGNGSSIVYCSNTGTIKNSGIYSAVTGGIVANAEHCLIEGCENKGSIYSYLLNSSPSNGNIKVESYQLQHVGGIAGHVLYCVLNRCKNYGTVQSNFQYLGGIAGYVGNSDAFNLENFGNLDGLEGYGFHSVSGIIPYFQNPYKRQYFLNCINHGNISVFAKYGIATGAGISAELENAYIANCYSMGSISASNSGNLSASFRIPQYEFENCEELNTSIDNSTDANAFITLYDSPKTLLKWIDSTDGVTLNNDYLSHPITQHGSCNVYVYPENSNRQYTLKIWTKDKTSTDTISITSKSPIEARGLKPDTNYYFELLSKDNTQTLDKGTFTTLSPSIILTASSIGYDKIEFKQFCDAKGVDKIDASLLFYGKEQNPTKIEVLDSIIMVSGLDEEKNYSANLIYTLNGKEYRSSQIDITTKSIIPHFSLVSNTPYSLTLKCDNFEEIKDFSPSIYVEKPKFYNFGGFKEKEDRTYELDNEGKVTLDSLLYGYSPQLYGKYIIHEEERFRKADTLTTLDWGGEGIIQLSQNAAMVHGLFGGMGESVLNGGYSNKYDRARFYYKDATASDNVSESYIESVCIDNGVDYATTIPMNNFLYQYYISLQYSRYTDPKNNSKNGEWQIIDARNPTVDVVEPRFYNMRFKNNTLYCSFIQGEEEISTKFLQYKIEGLDTWNEITISYTSGTEALSRTFSSIVPQLTYLVRMACKTNNGKIYYSPIYRLNNGLLELATDIDDSQQSSIKNVKLGNIQVLTQGNRIIIKGKNANDVVKIYNVWGICVYIGQESIIQLTDKGVFFVLLGDNTYKLLL